MKYLMFFLTLITIKSYAQTDEEKVKAPIIAMFDGMRTSDTTLMRTAFAPGAILQTIAKNKEGQLSVRSENINDFVAFIGKPHTEIYDERITFDVIKIDADLAIAWTPYQFYVSDKFSHCGVNSFQLVRLNGAWKIQYIIDTRRKEGCK
jgi:hypothetical protein